MLAIKTESNASKTESDTSQSQVLPACRPAAEEILFREMRDAFEQLDHVPLREALLESLELERESIRAIAESFTTFLSTKHELDARRRFFASWQRTNNSAMSVEGLANRMTLEAESGVGRLETERVLSIFRGGGRLNRVADEDLGVGGQVLHFELYYRMATEFTERDDQWQSRAYCLPAAAEFKSWLDSTRLRDPVITGLYSLLVHEGYTHAELEMIAPLFHSWATENMGLSEKEARRALAWISVHNGGTEKGHFAHSCSSLSHYCEGSGVAIDTAAATAVFRKYFRMKGDVMAQLSALL